MELQKWAVRNISRDISDTLFCFFSFLGGKLPMSTAYKYIFSAKHEDSEIFELYCMRTVIMFIVISLMLTSSFCWGWRLQCPAGKIQVCYPEPIHLHGSAAVQHLQSVLHSPPGRLQPAEGCEQWWPALAWSGVWDCYSGSLVLVFRPGECSHDSSPAKSYPDQKWHMNGLAFL